MNCPFYGRALFLSQILNRDPPFVLFDQAGNQCALITASHSPCRMEMEGETPDWRVCPLVYAVRPEKVV